MKKPVWVLPFLTLVATAMPLAAQQRSPEEIAERECALQEELAG